MMVDSPVWIDVFLDRQTDSVAKLIAAISAARPIMADLIRYEILRGFRHDRDVRTATELFASLDQVRIVGHRRAAIAAARYRDLRRRGRTVRNSINALIASYCIDEDIPLLFDDRDFFPYVEHFGLRRVEVE